MYTSIGTGAVYKAGAASFDTIAFISPSICPVFLATPAYIFGRRRQRCVPNLTTAYHPLHLRSAISSTAPPLQSTPQPRNKMHGSELSGCTLSDVPLYSFGKRHCWRNRRKWIVVELKESLLFWVDALLSDCSQHATGAATRTDPFDVGLLLMRNLHCHEKNHRRKTVLACITRAGAKPPTEAWIRKVLILPVRTSLLALARHTRLLAPVQRASLVLALRT